MVEIEDTYSEAFDGLYSRIVVTAIDDKRLRKAAYDATALPSTVFNRSEGGIEKWVNKEETVDGRKGAILQIWVTHGRRAKKTLENELSWRIRQGILVVPTTSVFNFLESEEKFDMITKVGHCGDGYEYTDRYYGCERIRIPIMMGEFTIERYLGYSKGVMGGNIWLMCKTQKAALEAGEKAVQAISKIDGVITPFDICSAGSKLQTKYPEIGPTTNHPFCPTLKKECSDSMVPDGVKSIPEIVINGVSLEKVKRAMKAVIHTVKDLNDVIRVSAGNYGGKLGKYKIFLHELI